MTKKEIKSLTISKLICRLVMNERRVCKEINFGRGLTKKTEKEMELLLAECKERELLTEEDIQSILK